MVQGLRCHPNQKQARLLSEITRQTSGNTGRIIVPDRARVSRAVADLMIKTCMALISWVPLNHCIKASVPCHVGDVGAHRNPRTSFMELQPMTSVAFSNNPPHVSIYGVAIGRSMDRVVDIELLKYFGHMFSPKINHDRLTDDELICQVIFGSCSYMKEQQTFPCRLTVNFNFENCMECNQECLVFNLGLNKNRSDEQQKIFDQDRSNICSDQ